MTGISSKEKEKLDCDFPMCKAKLEIDMQLERHNELRNDLNEIKQNQGIIARNVHEAVLKLEKIALIFVEQDHIKLDINKLGDKIRHLEEVAIPNIHADVKAIGAARLSWAHIIIIAITSGGIFGIVGFVLRGVLGIPK